MDSRKVFVCSTVILAVAATSLAEERSCVPRRYNTTSSRVEGKINVHLIPHTHDDVGWLKTVDQYYYGARQDIQLAGVQYVLDTFIHALNFNSDRTFSYAEMAFFSRWWSEQTDETKEGVKKLVSEDQLNFLNGGWVQHDEAAAHYVSMIDQTTRGHQFLEETFGYRPRVGWQIDPFGHSSTQASLLAGYLGFDALFFGRSDYQDLARRKHTKELELLWRGSPSFGSYADVFTGSFSSGNYGPPGGFYYEWGNHDQPVMDNICFVETNIEERVDAFVKAAQDMAELYVDDDLFWPMGTDFTYSNAFTWYKNIDKLIHYVNLDGRVNAFYSTPEKYVKAKHALARKWPLKTDDFFPYADCPECYWTGYFVSRPASKGYIRHASSYLQIARQLECAAKTSGKTDLLEEAVSLLQHHDSITGTEKQHVANDYHQRLAKGLLHASRFVSRALSHLVYKVGSLASDSSQSAYAMSDYNKLDADVNEQNNKLLLLQQCPQLNVSACEISVKLSETEDAFITVVYNPLAWSRTSPVRVPIASNDSFHWIVKDSAGEEIRSQVVPVSSETQAIQKILTDNGALPTIKHAALKELVFIANLPALGYTTYFIGRTTEQSEYSAVDSKVKIWEDDSRWNRTSDADNDDVSFDNGKIEVRLSASSGRFTSLKTTDGKEVNLDISGAWYNSSFSNDGVPPSGAYLFRPHGRYQNNGPVKTTTIHGPVLTEIRQTLLDYLVVVSRIWKDQEHVEVEWTGGPIPIADNNGKELVIKYSTDLKTGDKFYTDSNGREFLQRQLNYRPTWDLEVTEPIAGNYYPLTAAIAVKEEDRAELSILVDRAQGGTSLDSGSIEVMVHRRTLADDWRGVAEPLNETVASCRFCESPGLIVRGTHLLSIQPSGEDATVKRRTLQQYANDPVLLAFGPLPTGSHNGQETRLNPSWSMLQASHSLPANVHLLTSKHLGKKEYLIRLAHLYMVNEEGGKLSDSVEVDLRDLFDGSVPDRIEELGLAGAQPLKDIERLKWAAGAQIHSNDEKEAGTYIWSKPLSCTMNCGGSTVIQLQPMEIRTFKISTKSPPSAQSDITLTS